MSSEESESGGGKNSRSRVNTSRQSMNVTKNSSRVTESPPEERERLESPPSERARHESPPPRREVDDSSVSVRVRRDTSQQERVGSESPPNDMFVDDEQEAIDVDDLRVKWDRDFQLFWPLVKKANEGLNAALEGFKAMNRQMYLPIPVQYTSEESQVAYLLARAAEIKSYAGDTCVKISQLNGIVGDMADSSLGITTTFEEVKTGYKSLYGKYLRRLEEAAAIQKTLQTRLRAIDPEVEKANDSAFKIMRMETEFDMEETGFMSTTGVAPLPTNKQPEKAKQRDERPRKKPTVREMADETMERGEEEGNRNRQPFQRSGTAQDGDRQRMFMESAGVREPSGHTGARQHNMAQVRVTEFRPEETAIIMPKPPPTPFTAQKRQSVRFEDAERTFDIDAPNSLGWNESPIRGAPAARSRFQPITPMSEVYASAFSQVFNRTPRTSSPIPHHSAPPARISKYPPATQMAAPARGGSANQSTPPSRQAVSNASARHESIAVSPPDEQSRDEHHISAARNTSVRESNNDSKQNRSKRTPGEENGGDKEKDEESESEDTSGDEKKKKKPARPPKKKKVEKKKKEDKKNNKKKKKSGDSPPSSSDDGDDENEDEEESREEEESSDDSPDSSGSDDSDIPSSDPDPDEPSDPSSEDDDEDDDDKKKKKKKKESDQKKKPKAKKKEKERVKVPKKQDTEGGERLLAGLYSGLDALTLSNIMEMPTFSGRLEDYLAFVQTFEAVMKGQAGIIKLAKLRQCTTGEARAAIAHFRLCNENFEPAMEALRRNFGDMSALEQKMWDDLVATRPADDNYRSIRATYNRICNLVYQLSQSTDVNTTRNLTEIKRKFPKSLWTRLDPLQRKYKKNVLKFLRAAEKVIAHNEKREKEAEAIGRNARTFHVRNGVSNNEGRKNYNKNNGNNGQKPHNNYSNPQSNNAGHNSRRGGFDSSNNSFRGGFRSRSRGRGGGFGGRSRGYARSQSGHRNGNYYRSQSRGPAERGGFRGHYNGHRGGGYRGGFNNGNRGQNQPGRFANRGRGGFRGSHQNGYRGGNRNNSQNRGYDQNYRGGYSNNKGYNNHTQNGNKQFSQNNSSGYNNSNGYNAGGSNSQAQQYNNNHSNNSANNYNRGGERSSSPRANHPFRVNMVQVSGEPAGDLLVLSPKIKCEKTGVWHDAGVMVDTGSQIKLNISYTPFGSGAKSITSHYVMVTLMGKKEKTTIRMLVHPNLAFETEGDALVPEDVHSLRDRNAKTNPNRKRVEILLGMDQFYDQLGRIKSTKLPSGRRLCQTDLGDAVIGKAESICTWKVAAVHDESEAKSMWTMVNTGFEDETEKDVEKKVMEHFKETVEVAEDGTISVALPMKPEAEKPFEDNRSVAFQQLLGFWKQCKKKSHMLDATRKQFLDLIASGVLERAPITPDGPCYYMPFHTVFNPRSTTTPARVVFNASSKRRGQPSLNDITYPGLTTMASLIGILLRTREAPVLMSADVQKAYYTIKLISKCRDLVRVLFFEDSASLEQELSAEHIATWRFTRLVFGLNCSPHLLAQSIRHFVSRHCDDDALTEAIERNLYVDNLFVTYNNEEETQRWYTRVKQLFTEMQMNIREFCSNDRQLGDKIPEKDFASKPDQKVLGVLWNTITDVYSIRMPDTEDPDKVTFVTKRKISRLVGSVWDPLSVYAPLVVDGKQLIQDLWREGKEWDERIFDEDKVERYKTVIRNIRGADMRFYRQLQGVRFENVQELAVFADASKQSYAAVAYLRSATADGRFATNFLFSKHKLAPERARNTIPELELSALLVGVKMAKFFLNETSLKIGRIHFFSDSETVLKWMRGGSEKLPVFVSNRIRAIRHGCGSMEEQGRECSLNYVSTLVNPSDIGTRQRPFEELAGSTWPFGPDFLSLPESEWPPTEYKFSPTDQGEVQVSDDTLAHPAINGHIGSVQPVAVKAVRRKKMTMMQDPELSTFRLVSLPSSNNWGKLQAIAAFVLQFLSKLVLKAKISKRARPYFFEKTEEEAERREKGKKILIWLHQKCHAQEIHALLDRFEIVEDQLGLQFMQSRVTNSAATFHRPIIVAKTRLFNILAQFIHDDLLHAGYASTTAEYNAQFFSLRVRAGIKKLLRLCARCSKAYSRPFPSQTRPVLPHMRTMESPVFESTAVDHLGPLTYYGDDGMPRKVWVCVYTCLSSRLVHCECNYSLECEEFLLGLMRLGSHMRLPKLLMSDQGTTFKLAAKLIKDNMGSEEVRAYLETETAKIGIKWRFNVAACPWSSGVVESMVKQVKRGLMVACKGMRATRSQMETLVARAAAICNHRPLLQYSDTADDDRIICLRPIDLLHPQMPLSHFDQIDPSTFNNKHVLDKYNGTCEGVQRFWQSFRDGVLMSNKTYQETPVDRKEHNAKSLPKVGELVMIKEVEKPRATWKTGIVTDLIVSADGVVRAANLTVTTGGRRFNISRPIVLLCPLEMSHGEDAEAAAESARLHVLDIQKKGEEQRALEAESDRAETGSSEFGDASQVAPTHPLKKQKKRERQEARDSSPPDEAREPRTTRSGRANKAPKRLSYSVMFCLALFAMCAPAAAQSESSEELTYEQSLIQEYQQAVIDKNAGKIREYAQIARHFGYSLPTSPPKLIKLSSPPITTTEMTTTAKKRVGMFTTILSWQPSFTIGTSAQPPITNRARTTIPPVTASSTRNKEETAASVQRTSEAMRTRPTARTWTLTSSPYPPTRPTVPSTERQQPRDRVSSPPPATVYLTAKVEEKTRTESAVLEKKRPILMRTLVNRVPPLPYGKSVNDVPPGHHNVQRNLRNFAGWGSAVVKGSAKAVGKGGDKVAGRLVKQSARGTGKAGKAMAEVGKDVLKEAGSDLYRYGSELFKKSGADLQIDEVDTILQVQHALYASTTEASNWDYIQSDAKETEEDSTKATASNSSEIQIPVNKPEHASRFYPGLIPSQPALPAVRELPVVAAISGSIECTTEGLTLHDRTVHDDFSTYDLCAGTYCLYDIEANEVEEVPLPLHVLTSNFTVQWRKFNGKRLEVVKQQCPAFDMCDLTTCTWCWSEAFRYPRCHKKKLTFYISAMLSFLISFFAAIYKWRQKIGTAIRRIPDCCRRARQAVRDKRAARAARRERTAEATMADEAREEPHSGMPLVIHSPRQARSFSRVQFDKKRASVRLMSPAGSVTSIASIVVCLSLIHTALACDQVRPIATDQITCNGQACYATSSLNLFFTAAQREVCVVIQYPGKQQQKMTFRLAEIEWHCQPNSVVYTRNGTTVTDSIRHCSSNGACTGDKCKKIHKDSIIPELGKSNDYPGVARCANNCGFLACGCWSPSFACIFAKTYLKPSDDTLIELFQCTWLPIAVLEIDVIPPTGERTTQTVRLAQGLSSALRPSDKNSSQLILTHFDTPNIALEQFLKVGSRLAHVKHKEVDPVLECSSISNCTFIDRCKCLPADNEILCNCPQTDYHKLVRNKENMLPSIGQSHELKISSDLRPLLVTTADQAHIQFNAFERMALSYDESTTPCHISQVTKLVGCINCRRGGAFTFRCHADKPSSAQLHCKSGFIDTAHCTPAGHKNTVRRQYGERDIDEACSLHCGAKSVIVKVAGTLDYVADSNPSQQESTGTVVIAEEHVSFWSVAWDTMKDIARLIAILREHIVLIVVVVGLVAAGWCASPIITELNCLAVSRLRNPSQRQIESAIPMMDQPQNQ